MGPVMGLWQGGMIAIPCVMLPFSHFWGWKHLYETQRQKDTNCSCELQSDFLETELLIWGCGNEGNRWAIELKSLYFFSAICMGTHVGCFWPRLGRQRLYRPRPYGGADSNLESMDSVSGLYFLYMFFSFILLLAWCAFNNNFQCYSTKAKHNY